jgi:adenine-specific DNA-methyltransferase
MVPTSAPTLRSPIFASAGAPQSIHHSSAAIAEHEGCRKAIKPYLRGSDLGRWNSDWANQRVIALVSSNDRAWLWADLGEPAEPKFKAQCPSLRRHSKPLEEPLRNRQDRAKY